MIFISLKTFDPCRTVEVQATAIAQRLFQQQKDSLMLNFDSLYLARCLEAQATEKFSVQYRPKEYHYTLYYYDQAGNLVKTMPPAAVKPNFVPSYLDSVVAERKAGRSYGNWKNNENLATRYRYN